MTIINEFKEGYLVKNDDKHYLLTFDEMGDLLTWGQCVSLKSKGFPYEVYQYFDFSKKTPIAEHLL